tara:strand:- start:256 stop:1104 length:849 start_codon:yes stop_codon:yes gene_type:complete
MNETEIQRRIYNSMVNPKDVNFRREIELLKKNPVFLKLSRMPDGNTTSPLHALLGSSDISNNVKIMRINSIMELVHDNLSQEEIDTLITGKVGIGLAITALDIIITVLWRYMAWNWSSKFAEKDDFYDTTVIDWYLRYLVFNLDMSIGDIQRVFKDTFLRLYDIQTTVAFGIIHDPSYGVATERQTEIAEIMEDGFVRYISSKLLELYKEKKDMNLVESKQKLSISKMYNLRLSENMPSILEDQPVMDKITQALMNIHQEDLRSNQDNVNDVQSRMMNELLS